mgnify:CR=1 FL=1
MDMPQAINMVINKTDLIEDEMTDVMRTIMTGGATPAQIGGFLVGLRMKGETVNEITAAARVMRELAQKVAAWPEHLVDTCGTGGDASGTFNISTASAFVAAGAGAWAGSLFVLAFLAALTFELLEHIFSCDVDAVLRAIAEAESHHLITGPLEALDLLDVADKAQACRDWLKGE